MEEYVENGKQISRGDVYRISPGYRGNTEPPRIILGMPPTAYGDLRDVAYLQRDTRLDYTFIFQVDEFWSMRAPGCHKRAGAFHPQSSYLDAITGTSANTNSVSARSQTIRLSKEDYKPMTPRGSVSTIHVEKTR